MPFTVESHDEIRTTVFHIDGDIDIALVPEMRRELESLVSSGVANIIVDMSHVTYADSSALGLLVWLDRILGELDGRIVLSGANSDVTRILEIAGLTSVARTLSSSESLEDALGGFEFFAEESTPLWSHELRMLPLVEELAAVRERVAELIAPLHFSESSLFDIKVALGEALANAVRHGSSQEAAEVIVMVDAYEDRVSISVRDQGTGFDGTHSSSDDLYAAGGRGIMFMKALMDRVEFSDAGDGGTVVTLIKRRLTGVSA